MPALTLNQAAKAAQKSKSTLLDAINSGRMSASRDDKNQWQIEPAELFRVYPANQSETSRENQNRTQPEPHETAILLKKEQEERERERAQLQATIEDLRRRLDEEATERRKLTALLTHQPEKTEPATEQPEPPPKSGLLEKLFGRKSS